MDRRRQKKKGGELGRERSNKEKGRKKNWREMIGEKWKVEKRK